MKERKKWRCKKVKRKENCLEKEGKKDEERKKMEARRKGWQERNDKKWKRKIEEDVNLGGRGKEKGKGRRE